MIGVIHFNFRRLVESGGTEDEYFELCGESVDL
jgi:hypothetical protein